jgi:hypothetical protein
MKKLLMILALAFLLCCMVSCRDIEAKPNGGSLDWFIAITGLLATVVIPAVVFFTGNKVSRAIQNREIGTRYVELAIQILLDESSDEKLRSWALKVINNYSEVPMEADVAELLKNYKLKPLTHNVL